MWIISKFLKSRAGRTKCSRGLGVWDLCHRHSLATTTCFLDTYLLRLKLHCKSLITVMLSVTVFINDFILTFRRKKGLGQVITFRPVQCYNCHLMLVAILSYCKREIVPLQWEVSAAKSNVSRKMVFILKVLRALTLPLLTDSLQSMSVSSIKRMYSNWNICVGADKFLGVRRFLAQISANLTEKESKENDLHKKTTASHWAHCFQIEAV